MNWTELYGADKQPTKEQIADFIASPLWSELNDFLHDGYEVEPKYSYSGCSMQSGWNVKYQKAGRALCTLYPMEGFYIALVVIGSKEKMEAEFLAPTFSRHVQDLLCNSDSVMGARWLMIHVTDKQILDDVKCLIQLRRKIKNKEKKDVKANN